MHIVHNLPKEDADWLTSDVNPDGAAPARRLDDGRIEVTHLARLRELRADDDGSITDDENGLQLWIAGTGYPITEES